MTMRKASSDPGNEAMNLVGILMGAIVDDRVRGRGDPRAFIPLASKV